MGRADQVGDSWCILRTGGQRTVKLAESLLAAGFEVWTPQQTQWRAKTRRKPAEERQVPILPTFVFARATHLADLFALLRLPINPHPAFSVFRYAGRIPLVAEARVAGLREAEAQAVRAADARRRAIASQEARSAKDALRRALCVGSEVTMTSGAFTGMTGIVESSNRKVAWINFGGGARWKIDTWLAASDVAREPELA